VDKVRQDWIDWNKKEFGFTPTVDEKYPSPSWLAWQHLCGNLEAEEAHHEATRSLLEEERRINQELRKQLESEENLGIRVRFVGSKETST